MSGSASMLINTLTLCATCTEHIYLRDWGRTQDNKMTWKSLGGFKWSTCYDITHWQSIHYKHSWWLFQFAWSILLKQKDNALPQLKSWQWARENKTGLKIGTDHTDNGELKSDDMWRWLTSQGVTHQFTAPYTSAHIGHIEHMHCTLLAKARTMCIYANLPPFFWDEFYLTASHLHAKTTTHFLQGKAPWEMWFSCQPDYSYMHEIGYKAYVLILNQHNVGCIYAPHNVNLDIFQFHFNFSNIFYDLCQGMPHLTLLLFQIPLCLLSWNSTPLPFPKSTLPSSQSSIPLSLLELP